jgi:cell cycle checkpoint protein
MLMTWGSFNPVSTTILRQGIMALLTRHYGPNGWPFTKEIIDMMLESAHGDLRSAIMVLQFADSDQTGPQRALRKKGDKTRRGTAARAL